MKKRILSLMLSLAMVLSVMPLSVFAESGEQALEGNLLKITTTSDFQAGTLENLEIVPDIGNGAVVLADGATVGTYISPVYTTATWVKGVASWSASIQDGSQIEVWARACIGGQWTEFMTWGPYSPFISRGSTANKSDTLAYVNTDVFTVRDGVAEAVQMMVVLSRDSADIVSPEVRQIAMSFTGGEVETVYTEETVEIPAKSFIPAPGYRQSGRSEIGGSMCSPTTISVLLNSRDPELNLIPEALANATEDNAASSYSFGNWSFCASIPGLYGYDCYMQYASKDILLQELAQGRAVGISVEYSKSEGGSYPYLENAYSNTGGHLISIIGYEYEDGIMDDEHLYFISSDSYAASDSDVYRSYKWTQLDECWNNRVTYMIPSLTPETNATTESIVREHGVLVQDENDTTLFTMVDEQGNVLDLKKAGRGSRTILAYTVEGFKSEPAKDTDYSIAYEEAIQVEANNTFTYSGLELNAEGKIVFNASAALADLGLEPNDPRTVTIYVMGNQGYIYSASAELSVTPDKTIVITPEDSSVVASEKNGQVLATLNVDNLEGDLTVGLLIPENGDVATATVTIDGETAEIQGVYTDENGVAYAVVKLDPSKTEQTVVATWGEGSDTYVYDLKDVVIKADTVTVESGNVLVIDASKGTATEEVVIGADGTITLKDGETEGIYTSPVYDSFDWEYAMGFLGAYAPKGSAVDFQMRAYIQRSQVWSNWLSLGSAGDNSTSISQKDADVNMDTDIFTMRGSSAVANAERFQLRLVLTSEDGSVLPEVFNAGVTYKKSAYDADEAEALVKTDELPASAGVLDAEAYSAYAYGSMSSWRYENMALIMLNAQGADLLFEEVALANYDHRSGWGNWAMTNYKPGAFGYEAYTQYGASSELVMQALAAGNMVGLYVNGSELPKNARTNSATTSQTVVVGYYTAEDGTVMFKVICPRGDVSELKAGKVYGEVSYDQLNTAIKAYGSASARGLMYVVGPKVYDASWARIEAEAVMTDAENETFTVSVDGEALDLGADFVSNYKQSSGGVIAYTLSSEIDAEAKLAAGEFYYDIEINDDGTFSVPEKLKAEVDAFGTAQIYIICNNGETYVATLEHGHTWDDGVVTTQPTTTQKGVLTYTCECGKTYTESIARIPVAPSTSDSEETGETVTDSEGNVTTTVETEEGTVQITEERADGVVVQTEVTIAGEITAEVELPKDVETATVTIPVKNASAGMVAVIVNEDGTEEIVKTSVVTEEGVVIAVDDDVVIKVIDNSIDFADTEEHWAEDAVDFVTARELFTGTDENTFSPETTMTRAMLMTVLARLNGADTTGGATWYEKGMEWAVENNISDGTNPTAAITREQLAVMLYRYALQMGYDVSVNGTVLNGYADAESVSDYAVAAMEWACSAGIINGVGNNTLDPQGVATRAQVATMLQRFCENLK